MKIYQNKNEILKTLKTYKQNKIIDLLNGKIDSITDFFNNYDISIKTVKKDGKNTNYNIIKYSFEIKQNQYQYKYILILLEYETIQKDFYKIIKMIRK